MRILLCSNIYPPHFIGGAEIIAHNQAKALQALGHEVLVFAGDIREIGHRHQVSSDHYDGIDVHRIRLTGEDFSMDRPNFVNQAVDEAFLSILSQFRPDVVHAHNLIGLSVNILVLAKQQKCRTIVTLHDFWGFCYKNTAEREEGVICSDYSQCAQCMACFGPAGAYQIPIEIRKSYMQFAFDHVDQFISPSEYLAARYELAGVTKERVITLYNGIELDRFNPTKRETSDQVRFSFVGYLGRHKGIDVLLDAASRLDDKLNFHINVIGQGDQESRLRDLAENYGLQHRLTFWGKLANEDMARAYAGTDVLVLPSVWPENQPVSITEAMASGIPVIASRIGGIPELVIDGKTGWTFAPGDAEDLAEKMRLLIGSELQRKKLGKQGRKLIGQYSFADQAKKLADIYSKSDCESFIIPSSPTLVCGKYPSPKFLAGIRLYMRQFHKPPLAFAHMSWLTEASVDDVVMTCCMDGEGDDPAFAGIDGFDPALIPVESRSQFENACGLEGVFPYQSAEDLAGLLAYFSRTTDSKGGMQ